MAMWQWFEEEDGWMLSNTDTNSQSLCVVNTTKQPHFILLMQQTMIQQLLHMLVLATGLAGKQLLSRGLSPISSTRFQPDTM
jgi:hypothetical protein